MGFQFLNLLGKYVTGPIQIVDSSFIVSPIVDVIAHCDARI